MKINMLLSGCLLGLLCFTACDSEGNEMNDYTHYVNPFIGTGGHGHTHPGAMVPHGMISRGRILVLTVGIPVPDIIMKILRSMVLPIHVLVVQGVRISEISC